MDHPKFVIESSEASAMAKKLGLKSVVNLLPAIVRSSQKLARPPISKFSVAAAGLSSDGRIFVGVNLEFPGLPLHHSVHAEQFLVTNLSSHPQTRLENVVVSAYPCGHCRQFLQEVRGAPDIRIFVPQNDAVDVAGDQINGCVEDDDRNGAFRPLSYFLPHRFGPDDLLEKEVPLILETRRNCLVLCSEIRANGNLCSSNGDHDHHDHHHDDHDEHHHDDDELVIAALEAANRSHAPYSGCPSGVALIDDQGKIYRGSYMESAAYNPSLSPSQAAVIAYVAAGGGDYGGIVGAVLVEKDGAVVKQEDTVRLFFKTVSPKCEFRVFHCKSSKTL